jgi:hypothetical protein
MQRFPDPSRPHHPGVLWQRPVIYCTEQILGVRIDQIVSLRHDGGILLVDKSGWSLSEKVGSVEINEMPDLASVKGMALSKHA